MNNFYYFTELHLYHHKGWGGKPEEEKYILPFCLQMNILSYSSPLPILPPLFWEYMRTHYDRRMCRFCGRFLPIENKIFICLCHRRRGSRGKKIFKAFEFDDDLMNRSRCWKTRSCPGIIYYKPTVQYVDYMCDLFDYPDLEGNRNRTVFGEDDWYFITSPQPMILISFLFFCRLPWHTYNSPAILNNIRDFLLKLENRSKTFIYFHPNWLFCRILNTNTHLRSFVDTFHSQQREPRGLFYSQWNYFPGVRLLDTPLLGKKPITQNTGIISLKDFMRYEYITNRLTYNHITLNSINQQSHHFFHGK